jgi:nucleotide sugar dehydrogenase
MVAVTGSLKYPKEQQEIMPELKDDLLQGRSKICVFGIGYVGLNTMLFYAMKGVYSLGVDVDEKKVDMIRKGEIMPEMKRWLGLDTRPLLEEFIEATLDWAKIMDPSIKVFFIAVPTERGAEPWFYPLIEVTNKIADRTDNPLVIVESTVSPGTVDNYILPKLKNVAVCPRRDWYGFEDNTKNLKNMPRIVGGTTEAVTKQAMGVLSIVCDHLLPCSYREAEIIKAIENSIRHIESVYAQELALAFPDIDIRQALQLAGTKWNIASLYPNELGTGGYCIPLSTKYLLTGAKRPEYLTIAKSAITRDDNVAAELARILNITEGKIGILGLTYLANIKVPILSGCLRLLPHITDKSRVYVNDPMYSDDEIQRITGCKPFTFPSDLSKFDVIILATGHDIYRHTSRKLLGIKTERCKFIFDNIGIWQGIPFKCPYYLAGSLPNIFG